jgi:transcriptional regulator with XRE-family HTH domain
MNALGKLITARRTEMGWTLADIVKNSGGTISQSAISVLTTKGEARQPPRPATLAALARGLKLSLDVVQQAAAESAGYRLVPIESRESSIKAIQAIAAVSDELTPEQTDELAELVQRTIDRMRHDRGDNGGENRQTS